MTFDESKIVEASKVPDGVSTIEAMTLSELAGEGHVICGLDRVALGNDVREVYHIPECGRLD